MSIDEELIRYFSLVPLGEAKRHPDGSLFGYATESQLRAMFESLGVTEDLEGSRPDISRSAVEYLASSHVRVRDGFPIGIEHLIRALCERSNSIGHLHIAIQHLNRILAPGFVYITKDEDGEIQFHYGCIYDPNNELCTEADGQISELERSMRLLISTRLQERFGSSWEKSSGVTQDRLKKWREKRGSRTQESLIDYSDFYDLRNIIEKNWEMFASCFENKKRTAVYLGQLESFRNDLKHSRTLVREQTMLCIGISSDLLARIRRSLRE